jgi:hypothetical protein
LYAATNLAASKAILMFNAENENMMKNTRQENPNIQEPVKRATNLTPKLMSFVINVRRKDTMPMNVLNRIPCHNRHIAPQLTPKSHGLLPILKKW